MIHEGGFVLLDCRNFATANVNLTMAQHGTMLMNPAWSFSTSFHFLDRKRGAVQAIDWGFANSAIAQVSQVTDDGDPTRNPSGSVEISRWKNGCRIAINLEITLSIVDNDIVVKAAQTPLLLS